MSKDERARKAIEETDRKVAPSDNPPAGPHAKEHLTDRSKTPGAGSLSDETDSTLR